MSFFLPWGCGLMALGMWLNPCSSAPCWGISEFTGPGLGRSPGTSLRPNLSTVFFQCLTGLVLPVLGLGARSPNSVLRYAVTFRPSRGSPEFVLCASAYLARGSEPPLCDPRVAHRAEEAVLVGERQKHLLGPESPALLPPVPSGACQPWWHSPGKPMCAGSTHPGILASWSLRQSVCHGRKSLLLQAEQGGHSLSHMEASASSPPHPPHLIRNLELCNL